MCFFFQAEDGIRDAQESRGLGDVYKRQTFATAFVCGKSKQVFKVLNNRKIFRNTDDGGMPLSLIHI